MTWSIAGGQGGVTAQKIRRRPRTRSVQLERLEDRALLAALPYGAMPQDTGEYMLGDVHVSVVLMESNPGLIDYLPVAQGGLGAPEENWTSSSIAAVKGKIQTALDWWEATLDALPDVRDGLLDFKIDWTYADSPVPTNFEPIARPSDDYANSSTDLRKGWIFDFLTHVGFNNYGNDFYTAIKAWNDFKRQQAGTDWAFTIFVVNDEMDADKQFAAGGQFRYAFSWAGGAFMVVPADRPASTFAHETAHEFWAFDEYPGSDSYTARRGYYNTQNVNAANNPIFLGSPPQAIPEPSLMMATDGVLHQIAWQNNTSSTSSLETIGWKDSDGNGIFDVLDVPFSLAGSGRYDAAAGVYRFLGSATVNTLLNRNSVGLQNDITINQLRVIEASIDDEPWFPIYTPPARTYVLENLSLSIPISPGEHTIRIRAHDTRTGVLSNEFVGFTDGPTATPMPGASGFVFRDDNGNGVWDASEPPISDYALDLLDQDNLPVVLQHEVEPSDWDEYTLLNSIEPTATLRAIGSGAFNDEVYSLSSSQGLVFGANKFGIVPGTSNPVATWTGTRQLRVDFSAPVGLVKIRAYKGGTAAVSYARMEAYSATGVLLDRRTTPAITGGSSTQLLLSRPTADIAYVIIRGYAGTEVMLDTLQWGPSSSATTNAFGAYSFTHLPPGDYRIQAIPPPGHVITTPSFDGIATVTVAAGQSVGNVNFGIHFGTNSWHNFDNPLMVTGGGPNDTPTPTDALLIINWINAHPGDSSLPTSGTPAQYGYLDVDNDGSVTSTDALHVIIWLNANTGVRSTGEGVQTSTYVGVSWYTSDTSSLAPNGEGAADGENAPPQTAEEYFARDPVRWLNIPGGQSPCTCGECVSRRIETAQQSVADDTLDLLAADIWQTLFAGSNKSGRRR